MLGVRVPHRPQLEFDKEFDKELFLYDNSSMGDEQLHTNTGENNPQPSESNVTHASPSNNKRLLLLGLFVVAAFALVVLTLPKQQSTVQEPSVQATPLFLSLRSPTEDMVVVDSKVVFIGETLPNTPVGIYTDTDQNSVESDASGNFQGEIGLVEGINTVTIEAYGEDGEEKSIVMDIIYNGESSGNL